MTFCYTVCMLYMLYTSQHMLFFANVVFPAYFTNICVTIGRGLNELLIKIGILSLLNNTDYCDKTTFLASVFKRA